MRCNASHGKFVSNICLHTKIFGSQSDDNYKTSPMIPPYSPRYPITTNLPVVRTTILQNFVAIEKMIQKIRNVP